jgi:DNA-binding MarR family transcriptional regulator
MSDPLDDPGTTSASDLAGDLRVVMGQLRRRLREQANLGGLNASQLAVLGRLERDGPTTVTSLARADGMQPQSMGAIVAALEGLGLVGGAPDPADRRQKILSLTPASRDWIRAHRAAREDWLFRAIQRSLTPAEQKELAHAVGLLQRLLDP